MYRHCHDKRITTKVAVSSVLLQARLCPLLVNYSSCMQRDKCRNSRSAPGGFNVSSSCLKCQIQIIKHEDTWAMEPSPSGSCLLSIRSNSETFMSLNDLVHCWILTTKDAEQRWRWMKKSESIRMKNWLFWRIMSKIFCNKEAAHTLKGNNSTIMISAQQHIQHIRDKANYFF